MEQKFKVLWLMVVLFQLGGCADPNVAYVKGTVTSAAQEIPSGTRLFFERPGTGYVAAAIIGSDGSFELTFKGAEKIEPGDYSIFVGPPKSTMTQKEFYELQAKVEAEFRKRGEKPPPSPDWVLPVEYYESRTSPLRETVTPGENIITIEIK